MSKTDLTGRLRKEFFLGDVLDIAPGLLGKKFVRIIKNKILSGMIVEVEAYNGAVDEASHSFNGRTKRNEVMFMPGGLLYVYFTYGMHFCCNVVTGREDEGCAVLIRGIEPLTEIEEMSMNRYGKKDLTVKEKINLTNGPAKITRAFGIKREDNGKDLTGNEIFLLDHESIPAKNISASKRIGIKKSVDLPWRFYINDNPFVSKK
jgi:DNA-3-methyladenine glycosylase